MTGSFLLIGIWSGIGIALAVTFALIQRFTLDHFNTREPQRLLSRTMLHSAFRILLCGILLYFAFSSSLVYGLTFLITFLISRWISLFLLSNQLKP